MALGEAEAPVTRPSNSSGSREEDGQTNAELAIVLACLSLAIIVALYFLGSSPRDLFSDAPSSVSNAPGSVAWSSVGLLIDV